MTLSKAFLGSRHGAIGIGNIRVTLTGQIVQYVSMCVIFLLRFWRTITVCDIKEALFEFVCTCLILNFLNLVFHIMHS